jgi:hypothetical protein
VRGLFDDHQAVRAANPGEDAKEDAQARRHNQRPA